MICCKNDYIYYLEQDRLALGINRKKPRIFGDQIWKFQILLRKNEYIYNCKGKAFVLHKIILKFLLKRKMYKLGFSIPLNVFGPGLSIAHYGTIVVNQNAKIGKNCRIHEGVTIGATNGSSKAPIIGNNVFLGSGAKVIGDVRVADNICIGANAVVVKSFLENSITIGGVPAKKISNNNSYSNLNSLLDL